MADTFEPGGRRYRVMLVDDHEVVRQGIRTLLESEADMTVVGEAATVRDAVAGAAALRPDVIVMDVHLKDGSGVEATRQIRSHRPEARVVMLTSFADEQALFASILAGAAGYVLKEIRSGDLVRAVRAVAAGQGLLDPAMTQSVLERLRRSRETLKDDLLAKLTPHEERILKLITEGHTNREIGVELKLAEKTIKNYVSSILSKLGVTRRAEAAAYMARRSNPGEP